MGRQDYAKERTWLLAIISQNMKAMQKDNTHNPYQPRRLFDEAKELADVWMSIENPHEVWSTFYKELEKHDLGERLPSIIKEQLVFALHPDVKDKKQLLLNTNTPDATHEYETYIQATLPPIAHKPQMQ